MLYRNVAVRFKKDEETCTWTAGDSLSERFLPSLITDPKVVSYDDMYESKLPVKGTQTNDMTKFRSDNIMQFHGGLMVDCVESLAFPYEPNRKGEVQVFWLRPKVEIYRNRNLFRQERKAEALVIPVQIFLLFRLFQQEVNMDVTLPITGVINGMLTAAKTAHNRFLENKILKFEENPLSEEGQKFFEDLAQRDGAQLEKIIDQVIHSLTQAESILKATYLRNLLDALCQGKIDWGEFFRMNFILNQSFTCDLESLVMFYNDELTTNPAYEITQNKMNHFAQLGLADFTNRMSTEVNDLFETNEFGKKFIECALPDVDKRSKERVNKRMDDMVDLL